MIVVFKMCDSVPSARYSSVCNVLRLCRISLIPTYRVYRLYDYIYRQRMPLTSSERHARSRNIAVISSSYIPIAVHVINNSASVLGIVISLYCPFCVSIPYEYTDVLVLK